MFKNNSKEQLENPGVNAICAMKNNLFYFHGVRRRESKYRKRERERGTCLVTVLEITN